MDAKAVHIRINTTKCFVSRLIVKAAFEKECNCNVIRELSEELLNSHHLYDNLPSVAMWRERARERGTQTVM